MELHSKKSPKEIQNDHIEVDTPKKRDIFAEERQRIIDELRLE